MEKVHPANPAWAHSASNSAGFTNRKSACRTPPAGGAVQFADVDAAQAVPGDRRQGFGDQRGVFVVARQGQFHDQRLAMGKRRFRTGDDVEFGAL
jgi:hypothetical protein